MPTSAAISRRHRNGFTLVELMFVVLIMGVITASVVPAMDNVRTMRRGAARDDLSRMLMVARGRAAASGRPHGLRIDLTGSTLTVIEVSVTGGIQADRDPLSGNDRTLDLGVTYSGVALSDMTNGDATRGSGIIWFDFEGVPHTRDSDGSYLGINTQEAVVTLDSGQSVVVHPYTGMVEDR